MKKIKSIRIYNPLEGSDAKECTEINTPDLTINVPNKLKENATIANTIVKVFKVSLFSATIEECNNAVAANHGIKEAFSTGSQQHQPPQPKSL